MNLLVFMFLDDAGFEADGTDGVNPLRTVGEADFDVVVGEAVNVLPVFIVFEEDGAGCAFEGMAEVAVLCFGYVEQFGDAAMFFFLGNGKGDVEGTGALAFGVGEYVELGNGEGGNEIAAVLEIFEGFATHAGDDVHADEGIGEEPADGMNLFGKEVAGVPPAHEAEHVVAAGLEGNVEVGHEVAGRSDESNDVVRQEIGFYGRDSVTGDVVQLVQFAEEGEEVLAGMPAEVSGIDPREDDFADALRCGFLHSLENLGDRGGTAGASGVWDGAVGAEVVAAVLYFEETPGAVAKRQGGVETAELENVAGSSGRLRTVLKVAEPVFNVEFVFGSEHEADAGEGADFLCP